VPSRYWFVLPALQLAKLNTARACYPCRSAATPWSMTETKHQPSFFSLPPGKGIGKMSSSSIGGRLLSLKSMELPKRKHSGCETIELHSLHPGSAARPCKVRDLVCCVSVPYGGKATVGELIAVWLVLAQSDGRLQGGHGNLLRSACRM